MVFSLVTAILWSSSAVALTCQELDGAKIFSQEQPSVYLGFFGNKFASDSVNNQFGDYGSPFSNESVRNQFGPYGSPFDTYSARNRFSTSPPVIVRGDDPLAFLSTNTLLSPRVSLDEVDAACNFYAMEPWEAGGVPAANPNQHGISGTWANPATDSQGFVIEVVPDYFARGEGLIFAGWYTYGAGKGAAKRWYTLQGKVLEGSRVAEMEIFETTGGRFDSLQATSTRSVGRAAAQFLNCGSGLLVFNFTDGSGRSGAIPILRLLPNISCTQSGPGAQGQSDYSLSGAWADVGGNSGQGLVWEVNPALGFLFAGWYTFFPDASTAGEITTQTWYTLQGEMPEDGATAFTLGIFETRGGDFNTAAPTTTEQVGDATIRLQSCTSATLQYQFTSGPNAGKNGMLELTKLLPLAAGC
ncbi:MAG: hypothetical protein EOP90_07420 [Lysobacteraceae bacterium]|nr:MAG: hypothetical protein EOP90_07420 [Xanthomonadaceae bacterium]